MKFLLTIFKRRKRRRYAKAATAYVQFMSPSLLLMRTRQRVNAAELTTAEARYAARVKEAYEES